MNNEATAIEPSTDEGQSARPALLCCPFCGSDDLADGSWYLDDIGEVDAVECNKCYGAAPIDSWNNRA